MKWRVIILLLFAACTLADAVQYADFITDDELYSLIVQDIYEELLEEGSNPDFDALKEDLYQLHCEPINLNTATADQLRQLPFLSDQQIDDILMFVYRQPMHGLVELKLIPSLADYDVRDMLPFVCIKPVDSTEPLYWSEMFNYARHELSARFDARTIEENGTDPFYLKLRYQLSYKQRLSMGLTLERDPKEPFFRENITYGADFYGGWFQLRDVWHFRQINLGDFRAAFGQGLVLNSNLNYTGKTGSLLGNGYREAGIQRKASAAEYGFFRGAAATARFSKVDLTMLYSARKIDANVSDGVFPSVLTTGYHRTETELLGKRAVWQQVAGLNLTVRLKSLRLGITATENLLSDTLRVRHSYYNSTYFSGKRQAAMGFNWHYAFRRVALYGEAATAQNVRWGAGVVAGVRFIPQSSLHLTALYRYYSPYFDNMLASAFSESSRMAGEQGLMLGAETTMLRHWRLMAYIDVFHFSIPQYGIQEPSSGFDGMVSATYSPRDALSMQWRLRGKQKANGSKYQLRYTLTADVGCWRLKAGAEGNVADVEPSSWKVGGAVWLQPEYHAVAVPLVIQLRAEGFLADQYANRLYVYENDLPDAFSVPMLYGTGGRWMFNMRYQINSHLSLALKAAETVYSSKTVEQRSLKSRTRTEIHSMLRLKF